MLILQEVKLTPLMNGFFAQSNIDQSQGKVYWSASSLTGITSERGILVEIIFDVLESAIVGTVSPLILEQVLVYNEKVNSCGAIIANGEFLIVEKCLYGDLNEDQEITSADAIIILQCAVDQLTCDDYQLCAGDVNDDGDINSADAILVLKAAVKMITIFHTKPKGGLVGDIAHIIGWNFWDTQDDSLILFGDIPAEPIYWSYHEIITTIPSEAQPGPVNISIETAESSSNLCRFSIEQDPMARYRSYYPRLKVTQSAKIISMPSDIGARPSDYVSIPIEIDDAAGIAGMDLVLGFNPTILIPVDVERTFLTEGFLLGINESVEGRLMVSLARATGITEGNGALVNLVFEVSPDAKECDSTILTIHSLRVYDENAETIEDITSINGYLAVKEKGNCPPPPTNKSKLVDSYYIFDDNNYIYYPAYYPWFVPQGNLGWGWLNPLTNYNLNSYDYRYGSLNLNGWMDWSEPIGISCLKGYYSYQYSYQWPAYYWLQNHYFSELWPSWELLDSYSQYTSWLK